MKPVSHITAVAAAIAASMFHVPAFADSGREKQKEVVFTGWLHVEDRNVDDLVLVVEVAEHCLYAEVLPSGRFVVAVPVGSSARLAFMKPGHLIKVVELDTRHSMPVRMAERGNRKVRFDVVLEPEEKRPGRRYDGPVGSLGFNKGTGSPKVRHTLKVVAGTPSLSDATLTPR